MTLQTLRAGMGMQIGLEVVHAMCVWAVRTHIDAGGTQLLNASWRDTECKSAEMSCVVASTVGLLNQELRGF
jgi:hypothetical protein